MATMQSTQHTVDAVGGPQPPRSAGDAHVCAECTHAQLFAVQPRAVCTHPDSAFRGRILFAGRPACAGMSPRQDGERVLSIYGLQRTPALRAR